MSSRTKGEGSYNYVIFDDKDVNIEEVLLQREAAGDEAKGPLFQRSPMDKPQANLTPEEQEIFSSVIGNSDRSPYQRVRTWLKNTTARRGLALRQGFIDSFATIDQAERAQNEGDLLGAEMSATKAAHMTKNLQSVMGVVLKHGMIKLGKDADGNATWFDVDKEWEGGGFEDIFKGIADKGLIPKFQLWAYANRAQRLIQEGKEQNMSQDQIDKALPLGDQHPEFKEALANYHKFNDALLNMAEDSGLINAEQRAIWQKDDYVPFYRIDEEALEDGWRRRRKRRRPWFGGCGGPALRHPRPDRLRHEGQ